MDTPARHEVTQLLNAAAGGDSRAAEELLPLVYQELRKLAHARMAHEPAGQTLQPTALVHEAYLRLLGSADVKWDGRGHFFGAAARAMRRILVERARSRNRIKRGGDRKRVEFGDQLEVASADSEQSDEQLVALDSVLEKLEAYDRRKCDVVMLRYFAGLSIEETAASLGLSPATVKNEWAFARAWLHREIGALGSEGQGGASR
ncbi:MAG: sigma-70 family RNA polymerase sigma factor [Phycisphaerales bacterium]|nr:sigma-70 family RNA polymerase sigma factor [Phycisphaerales bacterium]